ncbi:hypothetical protein IQ236_25770 [Planktothrix mougeotii LEGE 06226]|uniref:Uncharacterized protein n=1 Tax=Planktothrix mougeotii LEGE 06226 TaxID=1828728 RepID=A0ABR9UJI3_9CYAN|nr:hypothetical protein [Planktothrix mougeotii LEGE 06226]
MGVPTSDIILGFYSPVNRQFSRYGMG